MRRSRTVGLLSAALLALTASTALRAQQAESGPKVGDAAPDFSLGGATRYGLLRDQIKLSSYRGNTVVLAFFFKARTKG
jgi:hypothetical protein